MTTPHYIVYSTWNESLNEKFPQVLEYRQKWQQLGITPEVTPNDDIRRDVMQLDKEEPSLHLLKMFDEDLFTTNMRYDVWRYTKLYLEGGIYSDVDVEPLKGILHYAALAQQHQKPVIFEESNWPSNIFTRWIIPLVSDYDYLPAYGTCVVIAPSPRHGFFLSLLHEMNPSQYRHLKEPKRTLQSVGPGFVTKYVSQHPNDVILVGYKERASAYIHHGFGTWKSWLPKEIVIVTKGIAMSVVIIMFWKLRKRRAEKKRHAATSPVKHSCDEETEETAPLTEDAQSLRKRHNHSPETTIECNI